ncbi:cytidine deaminase [Pseudomonas oryzihabitans]|uniref:cytidine deaminase n=1 Tax=Pseudomonas oryzihabitans TaxID=47885 RepID=UPI00214E734C|nr:cytidine deaminase [Pseudomonas psychrotolerans]UUW70435.1 cytidine deaminase [Pseudomonas psychrotolerans]
MSAVPAATLEHLLAEAVTASQRAYCPHSDFPVGAALLTAEGAVVHGCNVENISYGLTNCAERSALFAAVSQGLPPRSFTAMAIHSPGVPLISPCGACRQVLLELMAPDATIVCSGSEPGRTRIWTLAELLPGAFDDF